MLKGIIEEFGEIEKSKKDIEASMGNIEKSMQKINIYIEKLEKEHENLKKMDSDHLEQAVYLRLQNEKLIDENKRNKIMIEGLSNRTER